MRLQSLASERIQARNDDYLIVNNNGKIGITRMCIIPIFYGFRMSIPSGAYNP